MSPSSDGVSSEAGPWLPVRHQGKRTDSFTGSLSATSGNSQALKDMLTHRTCQVCVGLDSVRRRTHFHTVCRIRLISEPPMVCGRRWINGAARLLLGDRPNCSHR